MKKSLIVLIVIGIILLIGFAFYRNVYNTEVKLNQQVKKQWANVESSYQRRADLIPNLVNTVKGYADFEKSTLTQVIEARAKATSVNINAENLTPETFQQFQQAQAGLSSALSRLMVVVERYPELKANQNFLELQAQLEGTENRINVERSRFNETVEQYNSFTLRFLVHMLFKFQEKPYFQAKEGTDVAPVVEF
jgi:LemA protein